MVHASSPVLLLLRILQKSYTWTRLVDKLYLIVPYEKINWEAELYNARHYYVFTYGDAHL